MKKILTITIMFVLLVGLAACTNSAVMSSDPAQDTVPGDAGSLSDDTAVEDLAEPSDQVTDAGDVAPLEPNEVQEDYVWDAEDEIAITLSDTQIQGESDSVQVKDSTVTITASGNYVLNGSLSDGQIVVETEDDEIVRLILNNVDLHNEDGPAIFVSDAAKVLVYLPDGSQNFLSDGASYTLPDSESDEPNATLFSSADLTIDGPGALTIVAAYNDGISSKDGLIINDGLITVTSVDDGIRGKDYIVIRNATLKIVAEGDGLKSDALEDASKGYISIESGLLTVDAGMDALDAETAITISDGSFTLTAGGGTKGAAYTDVSMKGIKGLGSVTIYDGSFTINSADDGLHSNGDVMIFDGDFTISSGDDGIHADTNLTIENGKINILSSYEGLESAVITINNGEISLVSSDDGINLAGGADGSGMNADMGGRKPGRNTGPGFDGFADTGAYYLYINGGTVLVNAGGDGIDSNGSIAISGGTVIVNGPTENMNGALDYMGDFNMSGGVLIAAGSAGMAQAPATSSTQASVLINFNGQVAGGTPIHVETSAGETIFTFTPLKTIQSLVFSMPELQIGETYTISIGGNSIADSANGLTFEDNYSGGSEYTTLTLSSVITQVGGGGGFRR